MKFAFQVLESSPSSYINIMYIYPCSESVCEFITCLTVSAAVKGKSPQSNTLEKSS